MESKYSEICIHKKTMNTLIWTIQGLLAAFFLLPGTLKAFRSKEYLVDKKIAEPGTSIAPQRFIGIAELAGVLGLILPLAIGILPVLTPIAALALSLVMLGAFIVHFKKSEYNKLPLIVVLFALLHVVAWYRLLW